MLDRPEKPDNAALVVAGNGAYINPAGRARQQVELALETGHLPATPAGDLYKMALAAKFLDETERLRDEYIVGANEALHDIAGARIATADIDAAEAGARAEMADIETDGAAACRAARLAHEQAAARRKFYENEHVSRPEWDTYYDALPRVILMLVAAEVMLTGVIIVASAEVNGGLEVILPFLAFTTIVNLKVAAYIGRGSFRWRLAGWRKRFRLGLTMGCGSAWLIVQNGFLGYWRTGLDMSWSSLIKLFLDFQNHLPALTVTGLGLMLAAAIAHQTGQALYRGFTPEYRRLRDEEVRLCVALGSERAHWRGRLDDACHSGSEDIDDALNVARDAYAEVAEARRHSVEDRLRLRRDIFSRAREIAFCIAEYNQRVTAAWPRPEEVPAHYSQPVDLLGGVLRSLRRERAAASAVRREARAKAESLAKAEQRAAAAKAVLACERTRIATVIRGA